MSQQQDNGGVGCLGVAVIAALVFWFFGGCDQPKKVSQLEQENRKLKERIGRLESKQDQPASP